MLYAKWSVNGCTIDMFRSNATPWIHDYVAGSWELMVMSPVREDHQKAIWKTQVTSPTREDRGTGQTDVRQGCTTEIATEAFAAVVVWRLSWVGRVCRLTGFVGRPVLSQGW